MKSLIEKLEEYAKTDPDKAILFDDFSKNGITYEQLDVMSGKIYSYLKSEGIGKEDIVMICLPRGVMPVIAMVGIWKAGAAFTVVEDNYAPDRIEYIRKDCACKIVLDKDNWEKIQCSEMLTGHENVDDHDAAYAIYTSGTTGNPKGVLHEYGNIERNIKALNYNGESYGDGCENAALLSPMNFVASLMFIELLLYCKGRKMYIASYSTIKNPVLLGNFFEENKIDITFLSPSYIRRLSGSGRYHIKKMITGSEPANNLYVDGIDIYNTYAMSESGFPVSIFKLDKAYDTCPIGKPQFDLNISIIGDDGKPVNEGEVGELCFDDPYVRGYINLPEENAKAFVDGMFHSGDLVKRLPDGNIVLLGRSNDMIKINGNRIEPAEIEAAVKDVLHIGWAAAKGFSDNGQSFICAYYTDDISIDTDDVRAKLQKRLPYYMLPAYFIKIDQIPLLPNGKMNRKALKAPDNLTYQKAYEAPTNKIEQALCDSFAKVLKFERVGINDDFYEIGGDSLDSIRTIVESGLPGLDAADIFKGRTPAKIAEIYTEKHKGDDGKSDIVKNERALNNSYKLTFEQIYMFDSQMYTPKSTMLNLAIMMGFDKKQYDMERLSKAVYKVISSHPALLTSFSFNEDGDIVQTYHPEMLTDIEVEKISETEFDELKDDLIRPFKMIGSRMYRCRIFETEKEGYLFFDVHHTVFDGTSGKVFMENIAQAYNGEDIAQDYYYLMLQRRKDMQETALYDEGRRYYEKRYGSIDWTSYPAVDHVSRENRSGAVDRMLGVSKADLAAVEERYKVLGNEFYIAAALIAIYISTGHPDVMISWIYNGRQDMTLLKTIGLLFRDLPVAVKFSDDLKLSDLYSDIKTQIEKGIEYSCYPYVDMTNQMVVNDVACLLYQGDIRDTDRLQKIGARNIDIQQNDEASQTVLDMQILESEQGMALSVDYAASRYDEETMSKFTDLFCKVSDELMRCGDANTRISEIKDRI